MNLLAAAALMTSLASPDSLPGRFLQLRHEGPAGPLDYRLYLPAALAGSAPVPLLVLLHGCTQDARDVAAGTRMNALAEELGFLVAYPEQSEAAHPQRCWRWYEPEQRTGGAGEAARIAGVTREVMGAHPVDGRRVFVVGISAGAAMAGILATAYSDLYSAVAMHSAPAFAAVRDQREALAVMRDGPEPERLEQRLRELPVVEPVPRALLLHGAEDAVVSPRNLDALLLHWEMLTRAAGATGAVRSGPDRQGRSTLEHQGRLLAEAWLLPGVGHAWSGGSPAGSYTDPAGPDATRRIVRFLLSPPSRR